MFSSAWHRLLWIAAAAICAGGCVTIYQPMSGLHRPVAIDPTYANFADLDVTLRCLPGPSLTGSEAGTLCRKLSRLFENQGAQVTVRTSSRRGDDLDDTPVEATTTEADAPPRAQIEVELTARRIHEEATQWLWWSSVSDYTFAQDVVIRDSNGFMLVRETLTGRFVTVLGFFSDAEEDFSKDYYAQISQLALNAKIRQRVLAESADDGPG